MNTLNRIIVVLMLLVVMAVCSLTLIVPLQTLRVVAQQAELLGNAVARIRAAARLPLGILLAVIVNLVGVLLIILELRRSAAKTVTVEQSGGGEVTLSLASIADQLKAELDGLPEVVHVKPKVSAHRKGVVVEVDARIAAETGVSDKAERILETIRRQVEQKMGLKLARPPKVNLEAMRRARDVPEEPEEPAPAPATTPEPTPMPDEESELS